MVGIGTLDATDFGGPQHIAVWVVVGACAKYETYRRTGPVKSSWPEVLQLGRNYFLTLPRLELVFYTSSALLRISRSESYSALHTEKR